jgi:hypothetical protein
MSARKPVALLTFHNSKADQQKRAEQERVTTPKKGLAKTPPKELTGKIAREVWKETISLFLSLETQIITNFETSLLLDYCKSCEQLIEIDCLRSKALGRYETLQNVLNGELDKKDTDPKLLSKLREAVHNEIDLIIKIDGRADNKRKLILVFRQSLLMTPKSRGRGVITAKRTEPPSEMELIIEGFIKRSRVSI